MADTAKVRPAKPKRLPVRVLLNLGLLVYAIETSNGWIFATDEDLPDGVAAEDVDKPSGFETFDELMAEAHSPALWGFVLPVIIARHQTPIGLGLSGMPTSWPLRHISLSDLRASNLTQVKDLAAHFAVTIPTLTSTLMAYQAEGHLVFTKDEINFCE